MAHDARALYVGATLHHRDPAGVQPWSRARDEDNGGDFLNVVLDTFNDSENAVTFSTTPAGPISTLRYHAAAHLTSINARARMNFREGNDLWLVRQLSGSA